MPTLEIDLQLSAEQLLRYYKGNAKQVFCRAKNGTSVSFPVEVLRPFIQHHGISGCFQLSFDQNNRFQSIQRIR